MLEKVPLNYPGYALRDIETAVREDFLLYGRHVGAPLQSSINLE